MPFGWSIQRYLIALVMALGVPMLGLLVYSLQESYQQALADSREDAVQIVSLVAADTSRYVADARLLLEGLAARPSIRAADPANCDPILADFKALFEHMANIAVADASGNVVCSGLALASGKPRSVAGADWFRDVVREQRFIAGKAHVGPISGRWVAVMAQPLRDADGRFSGVIGFALDLLKHHPVSDDVMLKQGMVAYLLDDNDVVISRSAEREQWIGKPFPDRNALAAVRSDGDTVADFVGSGEERRLVARTRIPGTGWRVVIVQDAESMTAALWKMALEKYLVAFFVIGIASMLAFHVGRRIVRPMTNIARAASHVAAGDFAQRAVTDGPAEIVAVAAQFNSMLDVRLKAEERYRNLLESAADAIIVVDSEGRIIIANDMAVRQFGYSRDELLGASVEMLIPAEYRERHLAWRGDYAGHPHVRQRVVEAVRKDGSRFSCEVGLSPLHTEEGLIVSVFVRDLTERVRFQEKLDYLAQYDTLTGLPNRGLLRDRLEQALGRAERSGGTVALICMDLDRFTEINNYHGEAVADCLLQESAARARRVLRDVDTLARSGSDEFVVIVEALPGELVAQELVERLHRAIREPFHIGEFELEPTASIGVAMYPGDAGSADALVKNADLALEQAQKQGGDRYCFFEAGLDARAAERRKVLDRLRGALARCEFVLHYQPQVATDGGRMHGVEALLRWNSPELGMVPPDRFISLAEETGLIEAIGDWVLATACAQAVAWRSQGLALQMAVNLSARQFRNASLVARVRQALEVSGLPATALELEITEGMLMEDPEAAAGTLRELDAMGVRISVDDFGTGYSSLSYLKRFPVSELKIDRSFVRDIPHDADDVAIVSAVVGLAHTLRLGVVAEGVENAEQHVFLASIGCETCQGYFFSRPVPAEAIPSLAAEGEGVFAAQHEIRHS